MKPVIFTDLDDCLFQTREKCPEPTDNLKLMSKLADGTPSGYATGRQQALLSWLSSGRLIPVTARSRSVLRRVDIGQAPAICANGGCIIGADGELDRDWHDHLVAQNGTEDEVRSVYAALTASLDAAKFRHWIVSEAELSLYIVIKSNSRSADDLLALREDCGPKLPVRWRCHLNGNNLALSPAWLGKRYAVNYLIDTIRADAPDRPILGIGDSLSDAGFMDLCDFAIAPTSSQLWKSMTAGNEWLR